MCTRTVGSGSSTRRQWGSRGPFGYARNSHTLVYLSSFTKAGCSLSAGARHGVEWEALSSDRQAECIRYSFCSPAYVYHSRSPIAIPAHSEGQAGRMSRVPWRCSTATHRWTLLVVAVMLQMKLLSLSF